MPTASAPAPAGLDLPSDAPSHTGTYARSRTRALPIVGVYLLAVATYAVLSQLQRTALTVPDEYLHAHLASSLAHGDGFTWRGDPTPFRAALYIYFITPAWWLGSPHAAYAVAKLLGTLAVCTTLFPVWLLARQMLPGRLALIPPVLVAAGTWMGSAGGLVTENLAMPLATAALAAAVLAIQRPGSRWFWASVGFAGLAAWSRYQLVVLFPVIALALATDVARAPNRRARLQEQRIPAVAIGGMLLAGLLAVAAIGKDRVLGTYSGIGHYSPPLHDILTQAGNQWVCLVLMTGVLPLVICVAAATRSRAWREPDIGALLCVTLAASLVLIAESAFFDAGYGLHWSIQRYVQYAAPLALLLAVVAIHRRVLSLRLLAIVGAAVAVSVLLLAPTISNAIEERATAATFLRMRGLLGTSAPVGEMLAAVAIVAACIGGTVLLARRQATHTQLTVFVAILVAFALLAQSETSWHYQIRGSKVWRSQLPSDVSWLEHHSGGPVARLFVTANDPIAAAVELFNNNITQVYVRPHGYPGTPVPGRTCPWSINSDGSANLPAACGPSPARIWVDDPSASVTFYGQRIIARNPKLGAIVAVPPHPRVEALLVRNCPRRYWHLNKDTTGFMFPKHVPCRGYMNAGFSLDKPATLALTFKGGRDDHAAMSQQKTWDLPARTATTLRIPVPAGEPQVVLALDWTNTRDAPSLVRAELRSKDGTQDIL